LTTLYALLVHIPSSLILRLINLSILAILPSTPPSPPPPFRPP
jgi:hypothetical protein